MTTTRGPMGPIKRAGTAGVGVGVGVCYETVTVTHV